MSTHCTRCEGTGFLNLHQIPDDELDGMVNDFANLVLKWIEEHPEYDTQVCDCCGDGKGNWYGIPGEHYNSEDPQGSRGPYAYNGGLCECH